MILANVIRVNNLFVRTTRKDFSEHCLVDVVETVVVLKKYSIVFRALNVMNRRMTKCRTILSRFRVP